MIYECTDCEHCADFDFGYRIICLHPKFDASKVYEYQPLGDCDAEDCDGFGQGQSHCYSMKELISAEEVMPDGDDVIWEDEIRKWCDSHK